MDIKFYYENSTLTLQQISEKLGISYKQVFTYVKKMYSKQYRMCRKSISYANSKMGVLNPNYGKEGLHRKEVVSDNEGYLLVKKPAWYSGRLNSNHIFQHHFIICTHLNLSQIPSGWCVHHCDLNPLNNEFSNLVLMTLSDHQRLHSRVIKGATTISKESTLKWVEAHGTPFVRDDIVSSIQECIAANSGQELTTPVEDK